MGRKQAYTLYVYNHNAAVSSCHKVINILYRFHIVHENVAVLINHPGISYIVFHVPCTKLQVDSSLTLSAIMSPLSNDGLKPVSSFHITK